MESKYIQGTQEWLEMRRKCVTATDVAIILGKSPYETPCGLWNKKREGIEIPVNAAMQFGIDNEEYARKRYIEKTGNEVSKDVVFHPKYEWLMASLDGVTFDGNHACEIKSIMSANKFGTPIPEYHKIQMEVQASCLGITSIDYVRDDGFEQKIITYDCDPHFIDNNYNTLFEFYQCLVNDVPPPLCDKDIIPRSDFAWTSAMSRYVHLDRLVKMYQAEMNEIKEDLVTLANDQPSQGAGGKLIKITRKGNVDYGKIEALKEIDLEQYRKPDSKYWSLKVDGNPA